MKKTTADRLRQLMHERGLRQVDILEKAKPYSDRFDIQIRKSDLSQYVSGKVAPGQGRLTILGLALDVSEAWLMGYDVPMQREGTVKADFQDINSLTPHQTQVINAYIDQPEMQPAVDRILGIAPESALTANETTAS